MSSAAKTAIFARHLIVIRATVWGLKHITTKDVRRSCRLMIKVLSECRQASRFCQYFDEAEELRELGGRALRYAGNCLQTTFSKAPPLLAPWRRFNGLTWDTARNTLRCLDLTDSGTWRQSILEMILDGLWAHEAITDAMPDGGGTNDEQPQGKDTKNEGTDDDDLHVTDAPERDDFFQLANKAFLLCFGDEINIDPGELTRREGFETDPQHTLFKTGIRVASYQDIYNRTWHSEMFTMSLHVLLALAHSHSSWFHNQPVTIWNQNIVAKLFDNLECPPGIRSKGLDLNRHVNTPVIVLTDLEKAFWQRQHNAFYPNYEIDSMQTYTVQARTLIDIVRISVQAHKSHEFEYDFHTTKMFNTASQALRRIKSDAEEYFATTDDNPSRNQAFNPESELRPFPYRGNNFMQRQWAILNALDALYRCKAGDPARLIWAELVINYSAGLAFTILPGRAGAPQRIDIPALHPWHLSSYGFLREEMLAYTHFALLGVGQFLVEKFGGRRLCLWPGEEVPKTREQEMVVWIGFLDGLDGYQARLYPGAFGSR